MARNSLILNMRKLFILGMLPLLLILGACSHTRNMTDIRREVQIPQESVVQKPATVPTPPAAPDFVPVTEEIHPLKTRIVDITARNTPLRDVLHVIARSTGLNLVMEKGVNPEIPITLTLKNIGAEEALSAIFSSVDYFYSVKDNILVVKAVETRVFELGHPVTNQTYSIEVGGDILGAATSGTTGGGSTGDTLKGKIEQTIKGDDEALKFWASIESNLKNLLTPATGSQFLKLSATQPATQASAEEKGKSPEGAKAKQDQPTSLPMSEFIMASEDQPQQTYTINRMTGTIVITAAKRNMEKVEQYLATIRKVISRQVLVEAKIIEVELSDSLKYGIDWNFIKGDFAISATNFNSFSNFASGPVFTLQGSGTQFSSILKALATQGEVRTLSNPRVNIMNGQTSVLSVGTKETFVAKIKSTVTTAVNSAATTITDPELNSTLSGIMLGIVPYISDSGDITLNITPMISSVTLNQTNQQVPGVGTQSISLPKIDLRQLSTTVKVRDGEMIVIGGLISNSENLQDSKVPILGDIPWIGLLFTRKDKVETKKELVIVLQPFIVSR